MTDPVLIYPLVDGFIHNWLVLGPLDNPTDQPQKDLAFLSGPDVLMPRELDRVEWQGKPAFWITATVEDDHQLDWSDFLPAPTRRRAWAFAQIEAPAQRKVTLMVTALGALKLWHNGVAMFSTPGETTAAPNAWHKLEITLAAGLNHFLAQVEHESAGHVALAFGMGVVPHQTAELRVCLPTLNHNIVLRQQLEKVYAQTHLSRAVYVQDQPVHVLVDDEPTTPDAVNLRFQAPKGSIYAEVKGNLSAKTPLMGPRGVRLPTGAVQAVVMPPLGEFYEGRLRARRALPFWVVGAADNRRTTADERLLEAVQESARRRDLYAQIAHIVLGQWDQVKVALIHEATSHVLHYHPDCLPDAVGLSGLLLRLTDHSLLPTGLIYSMREAVHLLATDGAAKLDLSLESDELLFFTAVTLARQGDPAHATPSKREALATWLAERGQHGFADPRTRVDHLVLALSHLADLAEDSLIRELAAVLLDRVLYDVALHSVHGVYAPARGWVQSAWLRSGRFAPESALGRFLWGIGSYDGDLRSVISLGLAAKSYQVPDVIRAIALDRPQSMWAQERRRQGNDEVIHVAYKTPNYLLASLQDHRPGSRGAREQIWQATLSPEALIFTNHPTNFSQSDSRNAAWWAGNGVLPRVYQWQDALVALYHLPEDDLLGFTHAYFPTYAFDEYSIVNGWAFARCNDAYVALWAVQGFEIVQRGPDAFWELRSFGRRNGWVCQLGNRTFDGSFADFQQQVSARPPQVDGASLTWRTIRNDLLHVTWQGSLHRNGELVDWRALPHHTSPYAHAELPATHMDIGIGTEIMRLDFRI